jgi:hypothetical protein
MRFLLGGVAKPGLANPYINAGIIVIIIIVSVRAPELEKARVEWVAAHRRGPKRKIITRL